VPVCGGDRRFGSPCTNCGCRGAPGQCNLLSTTPEDVWTAEVPPRGMRRGRCADMPYWRVTDVSGRHAQTTHARACLGSAICFPRHPKTVGVSSCHYPARAVNADLTAGFHRCLYVAVTDVLDHHAQTADAGAHLGSAICFPRHPKTFGLLKCRPAACAVDDALTCRIGR